MGQASFGCEVSFISCLFGGHYEEQSNMKVLGQVPS